ncbi:hypothetical protein DL95DRAFT_87122 [Leptodontidium sp. 2 PMI_412]|nr:hypothetical protein DL95DRAFT_87122 [Leptodontidium sp. 2 PMI_412]
MIPVIQRSQAASAFFPLISSNSFIASFQAPPLNIRESSKPQVPSLPQSPRWIYNLQITVLYCYVPYTEFLRTALHFLHCRKSKVPKTRRRKNM